MARRCRKRMLALVVAGAVSPAIAQVDASWVGPSAFVHEPIFAPQPGPVSVLNQGHDWTTRRNWSTPPYPTDAGAATIPAPAGLEALGRIILTLDTNVSLRELTLANAAGVDLTDTQPALNSTLSAAAQGLVIRSLRYHPDAPSRALCHYGGNYLAVPVGGSGSVSVTGSGVVTFTRANPFLGPLVVRNGILAISSTNGALDARLGSSPQPVTLDGGTLRLSQPGSTAPSLQRAFHLGSGGGTFCAAV
ncbi:MAG: hypothetical protein NZ561_01760, partial [Phycisphaerae bacterium]|nr:hypothetical protein [Phycisphaerae bacterium]MDW8263358.1 hypothetical protein [Phycisphaerales bacterium]